MRVLMITGGAYIYGAEEISLKVIRHLSDKYETFCAVNGWNDGQFIARLEQMNVPYRAIKLGWIYITKPIWTLDSLWHAPKAYWQYAGLIRKFKPSVSYHSSWRSLFLLYPFLNNKNVLHVHDRLVDERSISFLKKIDNKVNRYIAISEFVQQDLLRIGIAASKIRLIYNGIDFSNIEVPGYPFDSSGIVQIGMVGQLVPRKGHKLLLEALGQLRSSGFEFRLHIFGHGDVEYLSMLKNDAKKLQVEDYIIWHGYVKDKAAMFGQVDFCVVPAIEPEPFGLTAIEPAVYKRPVIAASIGALPEIVKDGVTGILFEAGNVMSLKGALCKAIQAHSAMREMGERACEIYKELFSESEMNRQVEDLLLDVAGLDG